MQKPLPRSLLPLQKLFDEMDGEMRADFQPLIASFLLSFVDVDVVCNLSMMRDLPQDLKILLREAFLFLIDAKLPDADRQHLRSVLTSILISRASF